MLSAYGTICFKGVGLSETTSYIQNRKSPWILEVQVFSDSLLCLEKLLGSFGPVVGKLKSLNLPGHTHLTNTAQTLEYFE